MKIEEDLLNTDDFKNLDTNPSPTLLLCLTKSYQSSIAHVGGTSTFLMPPDLAPLTRAPRTAHALLGP